MPALRLSRLDCLVVDEMGKDVSGSGMDTNVIGRKPLDGGTGDGPAITRIFVRDLTPASEGNAIGVGLADFVTTRLIAAVDPEATRINAVTAMAPDIARLPLAFDQDADALAAAYATSGAASAAEFRMAWIRNTLDVGELLVSEALADELADDPALEVLEGPFPFPMDAAGRFEPAWALGQVDDVIRARANMTRSSRLDGLSTLRKEDLDAGKGTATIVRLAITMFVW